MSRFYQIPASGQTPSAEGVGPPCDRCREMLYLRCDLGIEDIRRHNVRGTARLGGPGTARTAARVGGGLKKKKIRHDRHPS